MPTQPQEPPKPVTGYTEVSPGKKSSYRLIYIIGMSWLMMLLTAIVYLKTFHALQITWVEFMMIFTTFAGVLIGGKLYQNGQEKE